MIQSNFYRRLPNYSTLGIIPAIIKAVKTAKKVIPKVSMVVRKVKQVPVVRKAIRAARKIFNKTKNVRDIIEKIKGLKLPPRTEAKIVQRVVERKPIGLYTTRGVIKAQQKQQKEAEKKYEPLIKLNLAQKKEKTKKNDHEILLKAERTKLMKNLDIILKKNIPATKRLLKMVKRVNKNVYIELLTRTLNVEKEAKGIKSLITEYKTLRENLSKHFYIGAKGGYELLKSYNERLRKLNEELKAINDKATKLLTGKLSKEEIPKIPKEPTIFDQIGGYVTTGFLILGGITLLPMLLKKK